MLNVSPGRGGDRATSYLRTHWWVLACCLLRIVYFILPIVIYFTMVARGDSDDGDDDGSPRLLFPCLEFAYLSDVDMLMHDSRQRGTPKHGKDDTALLSYLLVRTLYYPSSLIVGKAYAYFIGCRIYSWMIFHSMLL